MTYHELAFKKAVYLGTKHNILKGLSMRCQSLSTVLIMIGVSMSHGCTLYHVFHLFCMGMIKLAHHNLQQYKEHSLHPSVFDAQIRSCIMHHTSILVNHNPKNKVQMRDPYRKEIFFSSPKVYPRMDYVFVAE